MLPTLFCLGCESSPQSQATEWSLMDDHKAPIATTRSAPNATPPRSVSVSEPPADGSPASPGGHRIDYFGLGEQLQAERGK